MASGLTDLRGLVLDLNFSVQGFPVTVAVPGAVPVETRGIWVTPVTDAYPAGLDGIQRRTAPRVIALRRDAVPAVPRGTLITIVATVADALDEVWRVDGMDRVEADHHRVLVVKEPA